MRQKIHVLICIALAASAIAAHGQVAPSAYAHQANVTVGGFGSVFQPDYAGNGIAESSPNPLFGPGAYVDVKLNRWVTVEAEGRWLRFNKYIGISEDNYLIGGKVPIHQFGKLVPYGKLMVGIGSGSFLNGHSTVLSYGGGVDYELNKRWTIRAGDFEFQQWFLTPQLHPYGGSIGIGYKIF
jgi:opacity protein-like surface antigen